MNIEKKIKYLLELKRLSVKELCRQIGMTDVNLYRRFKANSIETKHLEKIAEVCNVDISYFFLETKQENEHHEMLTKYITISRMAPLPPGAREEVDAVSEFLLSVDFRDYRDHVRIIDKIQTYAFRCGISTVNIRFYKQLEERLKAKFPEIYKELFFDSNGVYIGYRDYEE